MCTCSRQAVLQPHERAQLAVSIIFLHVNLTVYIGIGFQLEACYLESQNRASRLQKELLLVREQLQSREREIQELTKELVTVKEELMMRYVHVYQLV